MARDDLLGGAAIGAATGAAATVAWKSWQAATERTLLDGKPTALARVDASALKVDPEAFQFKSGGDAHGVTDRLKGVKSWNSAAAGKAMVWENAKGEQFIADGHQRTGLAQRLMAEGHAPIKMDAIVLRERDGWSKQDVRAYAAIKNMHESSGNALDMAKVMRERPDLVNSSLPVNDTKLREAKALSHLTPDAFRMVTSGTVKPEVGAAVGEMKDTTRHVDMLNEMTKAKVATGQHARLYVSQAQAAPMLTEHTASLFGEEKSTRSLLAERASVLDKALSALKSDKRIFGLLEREAGNIESVGNKLSHEANAEKAEGAGKLGELVEKLSTTRGQVSSMLDRAALAVANGESPAKAARGMVKELGDVMKTGGVKALSGEAPSTNSAAVPKVTATPGKPADAGAAETKVTATQVPAAPKNEPMLMAAKPTAADGQASMFGEPTTKDKLDAKARGMEAKGRTGDAANHGLFGSGMQQTDLVDMAKAAPKPFDAKQWQADRDARIKESRAAGNKHLDVLPRAVEGMRGVEFHNVHDPKERGVVRTVANTGDVVVDWADKYSADKNLAETVKEGKKTASRSWLAPTDLKDYVSGKPAGWSDAARAASAEARGVAAPGEAKPETSSRKGKKAADLARIKSEIRDTLGPNGDGKHRRTNGDPITAAKAELAALERAASDRSMSNDRYARSGQMAADNAAIDAARQKVAAASPAKPMSAADRALHISAHTEAIARHERLAAGAVNDPEQAKMHLANAEASRAKLAAVSGDSEAPKPTKTKAAKASKAAPFSNLITQKPAGAKVGGKTYAGIPASSPLGKALEGPKGAEVSKAVDALRGSINDVLAKNKPSPAVAAAKAGNVKALATALGTNTTRASEVLKGYKAGKVSDARIDTLAPKPKAAAPVTAGGEPAGWSDAARDASAKARGVALPGEAKPEKAAKAPAAPRAPKGFKGRENKLKFVGTSSTLERGAVDVYLDKRSGLSYVADRKGAMDTSGRPLGMRQSPSGIDLAAAKHNKEHRFHSTAQRATADSFAPFTPAAAPKAKAKAAPMNAAAKAPSAATDVPVVAKAEPHKGTPIRSKSLGVLAPIGIAAAMVAASRDAKAEGASPSGQVGAAVKEGATSAAVMGGFMGAAAIATKGLMTAGMAAVKAVPVVQAAMIAGGAIHGAVTAEPGKRLQGAARGAFDMSLPGMVWNTGAAVAEAAKDRPDGRMTKEQATRFEAESSAFEGIREQASAEAGQGMKGFANPNNQFAAQTARGVENVTDWAKAGGSSVPSPKK